MIELKHVSKIYNSSSIPAIGFRDISVKFDLGEFVVITGDSGSGKTTLLNVISGLDTYEEGEMFINGINTSDFKQEDFDRYRNEYIGFVFQNYNLIDSYSGVENVMIPLLAKGISRDEARSKAIKALKSVGLERQIRTKASKLSGGEKQRTVIARALVSEAPVIVCDEPTGNLDKNTGNDIIKLLGEIAPGRLVIMVTHDYSIVKDVATRHVVIRDGQLISDNKVKQSLMIDTIPKVEKKNMGFFSKLAFAFKNTISTPKRTLLTSVISLVSCFAIITMCGYLFTIQPTMDVTYPTTNQVANHIGNRLVLFPTGEETISVDEVLGNKSEEVYKDVGLEFADKNLAVNYMLNDRNSSIASLINLNVFYPINKLPSEYTKYYGRAPSSSKEFALVISQKSINTSSVDMLNGNIASLACESTFYITNDAVKDYVLSPTCTGIFLTADSHDSCSYVWLTADSYQEFKSFWVSNVNNETGTDGEIMTLTKTKVKVTAGDYIVNVTNVQPVIEGINFDDEHLYVDSYFEGKEISLYYYNQKIDLTDYPVVYVPELNIRAYLSYKAKMNISVDYETNISLYFNSVSDKETYMTKYYEAGYDVLSALPYATNPTISVLNFILYLLILVGVVAALCLSLGIFGFLMSLVAMSKKKDYGIFQTLGLSSKELKSINYYETLFTLLITFVVAAVVILVSNFIPFSYINYSFFISHPYYLILAFVVTIIYSVLLSKRFDKKLFNLTISKSLNAGDFLD